MSTAPVAPPVDPPLASAALGGLKVLDLTRVRSGPTCVRQLADWGADVIKIEMPEALEPDGASGPSRHSFDFQNLHRNKRAITLNMKDPDGLALFMRMVAGADVVVENFRPDVKVRLGIDYDSLAAVNPRIILGSISGFGQDGPYSKRPGFDQVAQGMGGLMSITGEPGRGPMRVGIPVADLTSGLFCAMGILIAVIERMTSGQGQWVQTSLLQAQTFMLDFQAARYLMAGEVPGQAGNDHPTTIPTGVFPTSDGFINLAVAGEVIWERLARALDGEAWLNDPRFEGSKNRSDNRVALNDLIGERTRTKTSADWVDVLAEAGVPCGPINDIGQVFDDPQIQHLGAAEAIDTIAYGPTRMLAQPVQLSRTPSKLVARPPERGEHNDSLLSDLGLDAAEIADLRQRNVI